MEELVEEEESMEFMVDGNEKFPKPGDDDDDNNGGVEIVEIVGG